MLRPNQLLFISVFIVCYFALLYLSFYFELDFTLLGVIRELVTIPLMLMQVYFLWMALFLLFKNKYPQEKLSIALSALLLGTSTCLTIGSFL